ncbi:MAG: adenylosuccinate lyase [Candidatus Marinimicrobia bacterium]|nr:adenylosuccinate lyase [Candidatus Neomarinimicrobiota bacterium]
MHNALGALSPLDGRYSSSVKELNAYFSEAALMRYRVYVEVEYLIALGREKKVHELPALSDRQKNRLRSSYQKFDLNSAQIVKDIEAETNHDVKAIEYYIQKHCGAKLHPWIHFALTSEDINNISYTLMWCHAMKQVYVPMLTKLQRNLKAMAKRYRSVPMLSMTHGQPATPTTFGKELGVLFKRIDRQMVQIKKQSFLGKLSGATGTWSAHTSAYPKMDWVKFTSKFVRSLGLQPNTVTTQIESHDSMAESFHQVLRINSILKDLCQDLWMYVSRGILSQKKVAGEVGSSTMPHKINPIQFENAEGNLGLSNALLSHLAQKLPISRMQRDLTDSTVLRNQGVALGYSFLALKSISKGLSRITINKNKMKFELNEHWEVLAEAIQTILRKEGKLDAYEKLKDLTRGEKINESSITDFISSLKISDENKEALLSLRPESYVGKASDIIEKL